MGEGQQPLTRGHIIEQCALFRGSVGCDYRAGNQCCCRHGFGGQSPTDLGHHHHDLDGTGLLRLEAEAEDADFGQLLPDLTAPTEFGVDDLVAALGVVGAGQNVARGVGQHLLLVGQVKVHRRVPIFL